MILATRDRMVRNRVVTLDEAATPRGAGLHPQLRQPQFQRVAVGRRAPRTAAPHAGRAGALRRHRAQAPGSVPERACWTWTVARRSTWRAPSNLLGLDLHLTREKLRELLRALEEKKRVIELLDSFLEQQPASGRCSGPGRRASGHEGPGLIGMTVRHGQRPARQSGRAGAYAHALRARHGGRAADQQGAEERASIATADGSGGTHERALTIDAGGFAPRQATAGWAECYTNGLPPHLARAGEWFLHSGIQEPNGGVARYYRTEHRATAP